jgi:hypothetical protein
MASPECVYPWWGRNMVDDPEKHIHQTGQYTKHDPWETDQTRGMKREKNRRSGRDIRFMSHLSQHKHAR